jgi:hypothetical protein
MATGQTWVDSTRSLLLSGFSEERNKLSSAYTAGGTTLNFTYPLGGIRPGTRLCIGRNNFYVYAVDGLTATVAGGEDSTTDANAASGAVVRVNPRFPDNEIWNALSDDLFDLSSPMNGLFAIGTVDFTYSSATNGYDLGSIASSLIDGYEVKYLTSSGYKNTPRIPKDMWRINRNVNTTEIASGLSLELFQSAEVGRSVRLTYKSTFTMVSSLTANVSTTGLHASAYDLPPIGAAIRLMAGREIKRNFIESQGDTRRATEVGAGATMQSANGLKQLRAQRIAQEAARLSAMYPVYRF